VESLAPVVEPGVVGPGGGPGGGEPLNSIGNFLLLQVSLASVLRPSDLAYAAGIALLDDDDEDDTTLSPAQSPEVGHKRSRPRSFSCSPLSKDRRSLSASSSEYAHYENSDIVGDGKIRDRLCRPV
jgi:hypothetical protein